MTKTFETPHLPPTANQQWRSLTFGNRVRTYLTTDAKEWREAFQVEFKDWMRKNKVMPFTHQPIALRLVITVRRDRDIDGSIKPVLDALQGVLYANDRQVTHLDVYKEKGEPRLYINII